MKRGHLDIRVEQDLLDKIDKWRNRQAIPPSRASTISYILDRWFTENAAAALELSDQRQPLAPAARQ